MTVVAAYIFVLEYAYRNYDFLGIRGTLRRARNFEILTFVRTGLAIIHVPVITAALASTIPYATMKKVPREKGSERRTPPSPGYSNRERARFELTTIPQLFYLADRSWTGLVGWTSLILRGRRVQAFSFTWLYLAVITACSYLGFPILSLAYGVTSGQYWISKQLPAAVSVGGLARPYRDNLAAMRQTDLWMNGGGFNIPADLSELEFFNSSNPTASQYDGIQPLPFWANNNTLATLPLRTEGNAQLATIGVQVLAICGFNNYNATIHLPGWSQGPIPDLLFDFQEVDPATNYGLPYVLECRNNCSTTNQHNPYSCSAQSSILNITPSGTSGDGGFGGDQSSPGFPDNCEEANLLLSAVSNGPTFNGQVLSCVNQQYSALHTEASLQLARQGPGAWTQVANCEISITYTQPIVNPLIGEYIASTSTAKTLPVLDVDPVQFLNLSLSSFINFFHNGPPTTPNLPPITDGFHWVTQLPPDNAAFIIELIGQGFNAWNWKDILLAYEMCYPGDNYPLNGNSDWNVSNFSENVFLTPLAYFLSNPAFFDTGPTTAVVFETDLQVAHGRVPIVAALAILFLPMLWTLVVSVVASSQRRWTSTLDSFAIFRLGGDWTESMKDLRLASMSTAKEKLLGIPGMVLVDPESATVKLAYSVDSEHGSGERKPQKRGKQSTASTRLLP